MSRILAVVLLISALLLVVVLPLSGQTATPDPNEPVVVVGPVDLGQGVIMVNGYIIAPALSFQPAILQQGDLVVVIGYLLPDGATIQATSLELFDDDEPPVEATPEVTPEVTLEVTPEITPEVTAEVTPEVTAAPGCTQTNQPVAQRLADSFGVSYNEIINWHCSGFGFGEIARAYLLADASGETPETYFAMKEAGMGWGQIVHETGVHPSELAPGQVIRRGNHTSDDDAQPDDETHQGNSGNNGNGRGNGNGGGNGNGNNGNGNGNGRGNGNGNGRGNG